MSIGDASAWRGNSEADRPPRALRLGCRCTARELRMICTKDARELRTHAHAEKGLGGPNEISRGGPVRLAGCVRNT